MLYNLPKKDKLVPKTTVSQCCLKVEKKLQCSFDAPLTKISVGHSLYHSLSIPSHETPSQASLNWLVPFFSHCPVPLFSVVIFLPLSFPFLPLQLIHWLCGASRQTCHSFRRVPYRVEHSASRKFSPARKSDCLLGTGREAGSFPMLIGFGLDSAGLLSWPADSPTVSSIERKQVEA